MSAKSDTVVRDYFRHRSAILGEARLRSLICTSPAVKSHARSYEGGSAQTAGGNTAGAVERRRIRRAVVDGAPRPVVSRQSFRRDVLAPERLPADKGSGSVLPGATPHGSRDADRGPRPVQRGRDRHCGRWIPRQLLRGRPSRATSTLRDRWL